MNQSTKKNLSLEPQMNSEQTVDNISVSPSIANANVVGIPSQSREIKFRGKRVDNGRWVYGVPYFIKSEEVAFIIDNCQTLNFSNDDSSFDGWRVIPKTIVEYTGFKDKNGKEIYEGDIVNSCYFKNGIVEMWEFMWICNSNDSRHTFRTASHSFEVIGNIFENPELLQTLL